MSIDQKLTKTHCSIELAGDIVIEDAFLLKSALLEGSRKSRRIRCDVTGVRRMHAACIQVLISALKTAQIRNIPFEVEGFDNKPVRDVLQKSGYYTIVQEELKVLNDVLK